MVGLATIAPLVVLGAIVAGAMGVMPVEDMIELALIAGEDAGMITFGALLLASPVQWLTGRTQVPVRKYLGVVFFLLAVSNGAMFVLESGLAAAFGAPFLIAGVVALGVAVPLFLTSSSWSQRVLGMGRWRRLHRLTYVVAVALLAHVVLLGEIGPGAVLIVGGLIARFGPIRRRLAAWGRRRHESRSLGSGMGVGRD